MTMQSLVVQAVWDAEAQVYVATSDDVPGLVAEAATLAALQDKISVLIPELLELNGDARHDFAFNEVPLYLLAQHVSKIRIPG